MTNRKLKLIVSVVTAVVAQMAAPVLVQVAEAAPQFTSTYVRLDRHKELIATGSTVCATPTAASTGVTETLVKVRFPTQTVGTDFTVNATAANWIVDFVGIPAGATAWPGMTAGVTAATAVSGHTVTFASNDLTAATQYCFHITDVSTLTNGSAGASSGIVNATLWTEAAGAVIVNQTNWATALIADDQILVSAVVPPNFSISLNGNTDTFAANLDPAVISSTGGRTVTISTNAVGGWIAWARDSNGGLYSTTANYTIDDGLKNSSGVQQKAVGDPAFALVAGQEGFALDTNLTTDATDGCTVAIDAAYDNATEDGGGVLSSNFRPIAACTRPGAPPGTSDGDVLTLIERATIRGGTPAGSDYTNTLTIVGAGNF
jgi:hypothetical protein